MRTGLDVSEAYARVVYARVRLRCCYVVTMSVMDMECAVCHQPISEEEQWFRVREDYVHLSCYEKYLHCRIGRMGA